MDRKVGVSGAMPPIGRAAAARSAQRHGTGGVVTHARPTLAGTAPAGTAADDRGCRAGPGRARRPAGLLVRKAQTR
ncbi:hypothetical protein [Actinomycetospora aeridis]|uniref:Uncharacterized protein n=1 Tax=Actinomycetospora aeridis TaxID=3129231 RepID=A0ABU8N6R6_9PSEU